MTMYTQCPHCNQQHELSTEDLRSTRGMLKCSACDSLFDSLEFISEHPLSKAEKAAENRAHRENFPQNNTRAASQSLWLGGSIAGSLLLIFQFFYFETYSLSQHPTTRPLLQSLCQPLGCTLADYKNLQEISILSGTFENSSPHTFVFKTIISNQSKFQQRYPDILFSLVNFTGQKYAERLFSAADYQHADKYLAPDETTEISLEIAATEQKSGGYNFKLL